MGLIRRTPTSRSDLREMWSYIAERNLHAADAQLRLVEEKILFLSDNPRAGPARPELRPRIRSFPVGSYLIFYCPIRGGIELIRVLHGARNLRRLFKRRRR
jgi:toxin ParE1/3/4